MSVVSSIWRLKMAAWCSMTLMPTRIFAHPSLKPSASTHSNGWSISWSHRYALCKDDPDLDPLRSQMASADRPMGPRLLSCDCLLCKPPGVKKQDKRDTLRETGIRRCNVLERKYSA